MMNIAPMPKGYHDVNSTINGDATNLMNNACKTCAARKVKCDKVAPTCSACRKSGMGGGCEYGAPPPRKKSKFRGLDPEILTKLEIYERILAENDLLPPGASESSTADHRMKPGEQRDGERSTKEILDRMAYIEPEPTKVGRLIGGRDGERQFVSSRVWESLGEEEGFDGREGEEEEDEREVEGDLLSAGLMVKEKRDLKALYPCRDDALFLWKTHCERVEPICKILHIPSISSMISEATQNSSSLSPTNQALLFAIYHFAIFSLTGEECVQHLSPQSNHRPTLLQIFSHATLQSLTSASLLTVPTLLLLQSLTLHLISTKTITPPHLFWLRTGLAIRLAQRIGLHRDGLALFLPPFETQMRRRLWYQLLPLDLWAGQMAAVGIAVMPDSWDVEAPWNLDDGDLWEGMQEIASSVEGKKGATEMMFSLARATLGRALGVVKKGGESAETMIESVENEVEERFLRYADVVDPLHFLTICSVRSGVAAMRLKALLARDGGRQERKRVFELCQKIVDTDTAAVQHQGLERYKWFVRGLFIWGSWESLIYNLTVLKTTDMPLTREERCAAWERVGQFFQNHPEELFECKRRLHVAVRKLVIKTWRVYPVGMEEPEFIKRLQGADGNRAVLPTPESMNEQSVDSAGIERVDDRGQGFDFGKQFDEEFSVDVEAVDWDFWNSLIRDSQVGV